MGMAEGLVSDTSVPPMTAIEIYSDALYLPSTFTNCAISSR